MRDEKHNSLRFAFFPGCLVPARFPQFEYLARQLFPELGIELVDVEGFSCCPDPVRVMGADQFSWLVLAARNLAVAQREQLPILTLCPACTLSLASANAALRENPDLVSPVNAVLADVGYEIEGPVTVKHFLKVFYEDIGTDALEKMIKRPLGGFSVSYHSGCHENNPPEIMQYDNPFNPRKTEGLLASLGLDVIDYVEKSKCCGSPLTLDGKLDESLAAVVRKVEDMARFGAEGLVVGCTSCFQQLEIGQMMARRRELTEIQLPVLHFLEVLALAMGRSLDDIGFKQHKIRANRDILNARLGEGS